MPLIILGIGILFLCFLIVKFKLNGFLSLLLTCLFVGIANGIPLDKIVGSIEAGMGGTLGHLGIVLGIGAMFGKLMADGGGAQKIADVLIDKFGRKNVGWAVLLTGFIVGITLFWEVSFVILIPIIFTISSAAKVPLLEVGIPMLAAISASHSFLPPHPGPVAISGIFGANIGLVLLYGFVIAIPATIASGPFFFKLIQKAKINPEPPQLLVAAKVYTKEELPGFGISVFTALLPVFVILLSMAAGLYFPPKSTASVLFKFIGSTDIALMIALAFALYSFGFKQGRKMPELMKTIQASVTSIAMILLIIGAGGAFMRVIVDSGVGKYVAQLMVGLPVPVYILAYIITVIIRLAVGSATITVFTASGIILPLMTQPGVSPELMVLTVCCGSIFCDPPSDAGFWMVKEYFNLTLAQTFAIWSGLTTVMSVIGILGVLAFSTFI